MADRIDVKIVPEIKESFSGNRYRPIKNLKYHQGNTYANDCKLLMTECIQVLFSWALRGMQWI